MLVSADLPVPVPRDPISYWGIVVDGILSPIVGYGWEGVDSHEDIES